MREVRLSMSRLLERAMCAYLSDHGGVPTEQCVNDTLDRLLSMLNKDVVDHCKTSVQYFHVLKAYTQMVGVIA